MFKKVIYINDKQHKSLRIIAAEHNLTLQDAAWNVLNLGMDHLKYCDPITEEQKGKVNHSEGMWKMFEHIMEEK
jgi:hypothetical protein